MSTRHELRPFRSRPVALTGLLLLAVVLQLPLLLNPGYFSHDELSWAARADVPSVADLPWVSWTAFDAFKYRPLTFNLWLLLAHGLHDHPMLFHALWLALGMAIAGGLYTVLVRRGAGDRTAGLAAFVFLLNPYAVYVHGWVATLADLLWVGGGLVLVLWSTCEYAQRTRAITLMLVAATIGAVALLAKEAAIVLAPLAWLAWLLSGRQRRWLWSAVGLSLPTLIYLAARLDVILFAPRIDGAYGWSLASLPATWTRYLIFPYLPTLTEIEAVFRTSPTRLALAALVAAGTIASAARAGRSFAVAMLAGSVLALGPVLLLDAPYNQYGYGASLVLVAASALSWSRTSRFGRGVLALAALLSLWHGINIQRDIAHTGRLQSVFTSALEQAVAGMPATTELTLSPDRDSDAWIYQRLSDDPASYTPRSVRVHIVLNAASADFRIADDGRLIAAEAAP